MLDIGDGVFEVMATNGDTHLGGDDWDNRLIEWIADDFKKETGIELKGQPDAMQRIKEEAEKAKIALSSAQTYDINLPFITADQTGPKHIQKQLSRSQARASVRRLGRADGSSGEEVFRGREGLRRRRSMNWSSLAG